MRKRWLKLAAIPIALAFIAAARVARDDDGGASDTDSVRTETTGTRPPTPRRRRKAPGATTTLPETPGTGSAGSVTVFGVEDSENEAGAMQDALTEFGEANGIDITYVGRRDFEQQINAQVLGGQPARHRRLPAARQAEAVRPGRRPATRFPTTSSLR